MPVPFFVLLAALAGPPDPDAAEILLSYDNSLAFRDALRASVLRIEAWPPLEEGFDEQTRPVMRGAAVAIALPPGKVTVLTALPLVAAAERIEVSDSRGRRAAARLARSFPEPQLAALLLDDGPLARRLAPLEPAPDSALDPGSTVFTIERPGSGDELLQGGEMLGRAEQPLEGLSITSLRLFDGYPLVDARRRLVAVTFRRNPANESTSLAAGIDRIRDALMPPSRPEEPEEDGARSRLDTEGEAPAEPRFQNPPPPL